MKFLNLGCGNSFDKDWINIDFASQNDSVLEHNLLKGIPLKNNSVDVVYHSHLLEHFSKKDGRELMKECCRVLKKNGIIRIAVPNLEKIAAEYLSNLEGAIAGDKMAAYNYEWIKLELLDQLVRTEPGGEMKNYLFQKEIKNENYVYKRIGREGELLRESYFRSLNSSKPVVKGRKKNLRSFVYKIFQRVKKKFTCSSKDNSKALEIGNFRLKGEVHQWMYDRYSLKTLLEELGFEKIKVCDHLESSIPDWGKYQLDSINGKIRKPDSLFMEAVKK